MRVCASPLRFTVPSQLRAKRTLRNDAFSVTHVTAHGRGQDPLPPLGSALHCSAPQVSTTLYLRYSFCIVFHAPSTYTHNIYISILSLLVLLDICTILIILMLRVWCVPNLWPLRLPGTPTSCSLLPCVACAGTCPAPPSYHTLTSWTFYSYAGWTF